MGVFWLQHGFIDFSGFLCFSLFQRALEGRVPLKRELVFGEIIGEADIPKIGYVCTVFSDDTR